MPTSSAPTSPQEPHSSATDALEGGVVPSSDVSRALARTDTRSAPTASPGAGPPGATASTVMRTSEFAKGPVVSHAPL